MKVSKKKYSTLLLSTQTQYIINTYLDHNTRAFIFIFFHHFISRNQRVQRWDGGIFKKSQKFLKLFYLSFHLFRHQTDWSSVKEIQKKRISASSFPFCLKNTVIPINNFNVPYIKTLRTLNKKKLTYFA